jgi:hypothetical protein
MGDKRAATPSFVGIMKPGVIGNGHLQSSK